MPGLRLDVPAANDTSPPRALGRGVKRLVPHFRLGRRVRAQVA